MPAEEAARLMALFSIRLRELMEERGINQVELSLAMGLSRSTVNKWLNKKAIPRMAIIDKLASYFDVQRSYFLEEDGKTNKRAYYLDPETAKMAQEVYDNPDLRILFDASRDLRPEDIRFVVDMVMRMKRGNCNE